MKIALILGALLVAYVAADDECPMKKMMTESYKECVDELKSTDEAQENVQNNKGENDKASNDLRGCAMQKSGIMNEGKIDYEKLESTMRSNKDADPKRVDAILATLKVCKEPSETSSDNSEVAGNYVKCLNELSKEADKS